MSDCEPKRRRLYLTALVSVTVLSFVLTGCSAQEVEAPTRSPHGLAQDVLSLRQGAPLKDVRAELGKPVAEVADDREATLIYPSWQLRFYDGGLRQRVRQARSGRSTPAGHSLDQKILQLVKPGMTVQMVRRRLGAPEVYEQIYEATPRPAVVLRYAYWELYFDRGQLVRRTQN